MSCTNTPIAGFNVYEKEINKDMQILSEETRGRAAAARVSTSAAAAAAAAERSQ